MLTLMQNHCPQTIKKGKASHGRIFKTRKRINIFGADRRTVFQIQGSQGLVTEQSLHQQTAGNPLENRSQTKENLCEICVESMLGKVMPK